MRDPRNQQLSLMELLLCLADLDALVECFQWVSNVRSSLLSWHGQEIGRRRKQLANCYIVHHVDCLVGTK